ncbi:hypothetical protein SISSUDRAFT_990271 [Sistotremastrum suecicum HHB10207 ss-3]|uniref:non-specific serine/threonine protein kinase n=1 Tax=Sistotremastrum suecicum HHB10207 ss-3 TaxID=1314776 RepID=A0A166ARD8_9AGAM|nr:hypothetical protein SISSUDRAFT_990271 [Sistotremastrum suecicum HHB10207 ss-3]
MSLKILNDSTLIAQGAEALDTTWDVDDTQPKPILLKYRFPKTYRHHSLNASITKQRIGTEARALVRCRKFGVKVPGVRMVDLENGLLGIEWIDGMSVRQILGGEDDVEIEDERVDHLGKFGISQDTLLSLIGTEIAKMHRADIIHGDLTTSNMMLRTRSPSSTSSSQPSSSAELLLIDFGLSSASSMPEDKAVDLYVLERAFSSTHPDSEPLFAQVLDAYGKETGAKWPAIEKRLDEVRMRGRKRSMVG